MLLNGLALTASAPREVTSASSEPSKQYYRLLSKSSSVAERSRSIFIVWSIRILLVVLTYLGWYYSTIIQHNINILWKFLLDTWIFNCVYFETWWTTSCYTVIVLVPMIMNYVKQLDKYKIQPSVKYVHYSIIGMLVDTAIYFVPLMMLDSVVVKKYHDVNPTYWAERGRHWIQTTRALPFAPPTLGYLVFDLIASIIVYDLLFFAVHFALHKNYWLYKHIHAHHHDHPHMHCHVTNQLTVIERLALVISANFALKLFNSHPLTRAFFVPIFLSILVDNHSGYDLPWGLDKIVPFNLFGGCPKHFAHHDTGSGNYEPIFTYLDTMLNWKKTLRPTNIH